MVTDKFIGILFSYIGNPAKLSFEEDESANSEVNLNSEIILGFISDHEEKHLRPLLIPRKDITPDIVFKVACEVLQMPRWTFDEKKSSTLKYISDTIRMDLPFDSRWPMTVTDTHKFFEGLMRHGIDMHNLIGVGLAEKRTV